MAPTVRLNHGCSVCTQRDHHCSDQDGEFRQDAYSARLRTSTVPVRVQHSDLFVYTRCESAKRGLRKTDQSQSFRNFFVLCKRQHVRASKPMQRVSETRHLKRRQHAHAAHKGYFRNPEPHLPQRPTSSENPTFHSTSAIRQNLGTSPSEMSKDVVLTLSLVFDSAIVVVSDRVSRLRIQS